MPWPIDGLFSSHSHRHFYTAGVYALITRSIWKNLSPFATASRRIAIHAPGVATVARLRIDVHNNNDNNDNGWQSGPLWPHRMGPITYSMCCRTLTVLHFASGSRWVRSTVMSMSVCTSVCQIAYLRNHTAEHYCVLYLTTVAEGSVLLWRYVMYFRFGFDDVMFSHNGWTQWYEQHWLFQTFAEDVSVCAILVHAAH